MNKTMINFLMTYLFTMRKIITISHKMSDNLKDVGMADRNMWMVKISPFLFG